MGEQPDESVCKSVYKSMYSPEQLAALKQQLPEQQWRMENLARQLRELLTLGEVLGAGDYPTERPAFVRQLAHHQAGATGYRVPRKFRNLSLVQGLQCGVTSALSGSFSEYIPFSQLRTGGGSLHGGQGYRKSVHPGC